MASSKSNLYKRAGITDLAEFYRTKFASDEVLDARYFRALDRFDVRFARTMWIYDNVRPFSRVLDLGCGAGMLALLKRKGVTLAGIDLSQECALGARRNGYDVALCADLKSLPFPDASFDYVVSLDVLGHVGFEDKDDVLAEIKRVLRPDGVTMHGIECIDRSLQKGYEEMSADELRRFVAIDGHVGLEEEQEHAARFRKFFTHVEARPRYTLCLSSEEFVKQAEEYHLPFEPDFIAYLRGLTFAERRAFDMAMGYVFGKISDLNVNLPKSGLYVFIKASPGPLGPFYNEHRDRRGLFPNGGEHPDTASRCLDRSPDVIFDGGWFEPNVLPPVARWMGARACVSFRTPSLSRIRFDLTSHMPDLSQRPLGLELRLNGELLSAVSILSAGWFELSADVSEISATNANGDFQLEFIADRTWQPRPNDKDDRDDREISIAVCNLEISSQ